MATKIIMPKLGMAMTEGVVVKWLKQDGEPVEKGETIVVVMSKKITYEVEAPVSGILRIVAQPKETRAVGEVIGYITAPGEPLPEEEVAVAVTAPPEEKAVPPPPPAAKPAPPKEKKFVRASPAARRLARELGVDLAQVPGSGPGGRVTEADVRRFHEEEQARREAVPAVLATPLARKMAKEEGLDLSRIKGTGPGGKITEADVLRALEERAPEEAPRRRVIPFTGMRQAIAEQMMHSLHSMAQLTLTSKADVTALVELREALRARWEERISYTDLIVKAVALALREHPLLNATLVGEEIVLLDEVNIGVAVALEEGLIVPVVRQADKKSVREISHTIRDLAQRAREGTLNVDEVTGSTFTITNLGMYGIDAFTPIINPPEVAILGVGRITEELALVQGQVGVRSVMMLSLTIDHRVVDGAPAAAFLDTVRGYLEQPALIFAAR